MNFGGLRRTRENAGVESGMFDGEDGPRVFQMLHL
jgi:hypothetical protein